LLLFMSKLAFFFFSSRRRHTRFSRDWSSDVCSSDLDLNHARAVLDGQIGQDILTKFPDRQLIALAWGEQGFRHITNNRQPIEKRSEERRVGKSVDNGGGGRYKKDETRMSRSWNRIYS